MNFFSHLSLVQELRWCVESDGALISPPPWVPEEKSGIDARLIVGGVERDCALRDEDGLEEEPSDGFSSSSRSVGEMSLAHSLAALRRIQFFLSFFKTVNNCRFSSPSRGIFTRKKVIHFQSARLVKKERGNIRGAVMRRPQKKMAAVFIFGGGRGGTRLIRRQVEW